MASLAAFDRRKGSHRLGIAGIDEAGRGSLCGPVVASAVLLEAGIYSDKRLLRRFSGANDSKKLSPAKRIALRSTIAEIEGEGKIKVTWAMSSVLEISAHNILGATRIAMARCIAKLAVEPLSHLFATAGVEGELFGRTDERTYMVLVDGLPLSPFAWAHEAVKGGDGKSLAIALASIVAKVERDRLMTAMDAQYPKYGFAIHKGYGTPEHVNALRLHGPCPEHRHLFISKILNGEPPQPEYIDSEFPFEES